MRAKDNIKFVPVDTEDNIKSLPKLHIDKQKLG
jgi:hypothetical protein